MKDCKYFKEQIILKIFNEEYDNELSEHIERCDSCREYMAETRRQFCKEPATIDFNVIKNKIIERGNIKKYYRRIKFIATAAAACLVIVLSMTLLNNNSEYIKNINVRTETQDLVTEGGDFEQLDNLSSEMDNIQNEIDSFDETLWL